MASAMMPGVSTGWRVVARANAALNVVIAPNKTSFWALAFGIRHQDPWGTGHQAERPALERPAVVLRVTFPKSVGR